MLNLFAYFKYVSYLCKVDRIGVATNPKRYAESPATLQFFGSLNFGKKMANKKSLNDIKKAFIDVWGGRYDYSQIVPSNYVNTNSLVPIICEEHGVFYMTPQNHLKKHGCPSCANEKRRRPRVNARGLVCGVGVFDAAYKRDSDNITSTAYRCWHNMLIRCYDKKYQAKEPTYIGCGVCEEWLVFSNFKKWFDENYIKGYQLDKDILVKGNKIYSPDTCCFVPKRINTIINKHRKRIGNLPIGVTQDCDSTYVAAMCKLNNYVVIGRYDSPHAAFKAYKLEKEDYIKKVATKYYSDGKINEKVYKALLNYKVEITD